MFTKIYSVKKRGYKTMCTELAFFAKNKTKQNKTKPKNV